MSTGFWTGSNTTDQHPTNRTRRNTISLTLPQMHNSNWVIFSSVNLALNSLNKDYVYDGDMSTYRSIPAATVRLNGHFVIEAIRIHTCKCILYFCFADKFCILHVSTIFIIATRSYKNNTKPFNKIKWWPRFHKVVGVFCINRGKTSGVEDKNESPEGTWGFSKKRNSNFV